MNQPFQLQPFQPTPATDLLRLTGQVGQQGSRLALRYELTGDLSHVVIATPQLNPQLTPQRQDNLWQHTCFEFFVGLANQSTYWEFNLSPNGNWNVYRFTDYRKGMVWEEEFANLPFRISSDPHLFCLDLEADLSGLMSATPPLMLGITTVIEHADPEGEAISYWALTHPGHQADFHRRDSFIVELAV